MADQPKPKPVEPVLTKREAFAMAAMQGILAGRRKGLRSYTKQEVADDAVAFADALIRRLL